MGYAFLFVLPWFLFSAVPATGLAIRRATD
jgi:hypothetical protein